MAGFNVAGLPSFIQYQGQLQAQEQARQKQQQDLLLFQQAQQDRQRQQAAAQAAGNALPGLLAQPPQSVPMQPAPQPPMPGQASQPQMPAPPQGVGQTAPLPGQGPAPGALQPPLPPFKPMPSSPPPQAAAPQGTIPTPPQPQAAQSAPGGPLTLQSAIKTLQDQGLSGADLMAGLGQLMPVLDTQAKQQAAQLQMQFNNEVKLAGIQDRHDALAERAREADQRSSDMKLSIQERAQAAQESAAIRRDSMAMRMEIAKMTHAANPDAKLDPEDVHFLAQQAMAGDTSVYQNLGRGVQGAQNIVAIRKEVARLQKAAGNTGADQAAANAAFQGEKAAARTGAVRATNIGMAGQEAQKLGDLALQASDQLARTNAPTINAGLNKLREQGGDAQITQFNVALNGFKNAYSRAISPSGAPTVHDKQHADELFSTNQSPAQFRAAMAQAKKEMAAALAAPKDVMSAQKARISGRQSESVAPAVGTVEGGYRFKGGDPSSPSSWEKQ